MVKHTQPDVWDLTVVSFTKVKKLKHWTILWAKRRSEQEWRGQGEFKSVAIKQCFCSSATEAGPDCRVQG